MVWTPNRAGGEPEMEGSWLLMACGIAVVVVVLAVVLVIAMAMPPSRQKHAQSVLDIIPRTVLAWRGRGEAEVSGPEVLESGSTPAPEEEQTPSANSGTESRP
jgi:hypothetical protein